MNLNNTQQNFHILYMQTEMYQHVYNIDSKMYLYLINLKINPWDNFMHHSQQKLHRSTPDSGHDNRHCFSTFVPIVLQSALLIAGHLLARPSSVNHFLPCCSLSYSKYLLTLAMPSSGSFCEKCLCNFNYWLLRDIRYV